MGENLRGKNGISIKLLTEKLRKEMIRPTQKPESKRKIKNSSKIRKINNFRLGTYKHWIKNIS